MGDTAGQLRVRDDALRVARAGGGLEELVRTLVGRADRCAIDAAAEALRHGDPRDELRQRALALLRGARDTGLF